MSGGIPVQKERVLSLLSSLVDKSLVAYEEQPDGTGRYRLLETTQQYAREKIQICSEEEQAQHRHRDYFLHLAEEAEPQLQGAQQRIWMDRLEIEQENLREALSLCQGCSERGAEESAERGLRLCGALTRFWLTRGYLSEGRERYRAALSSPGGAGRTRWRAKALLGAGILARMQGDFDSARSLLEESLAIYQEVENPSGVAAALGNLGLVAKDRCDYAGARTYLEQSLFVRRKIGERPRLADPLSNLGLVALHQQDYPTARALFEESLAIRREFGDRRGIAISLGSLGNIDYTLGDFASARALHEECLSIRRELGDQRGIAIALHNLGQVAARQSDYAGARAYHEQSLALYQELGNRNEIANSLCLLGFAAVGLHDHGVARALLVESLSIRREVGGPFATAELLESFLFLSSSQRQWVRTGRFWGAAQRLRDESQTPLPPSVQLECDLILSAGRSALGEEAWAAALSEGRAMTLDEALDYALTTGEDEVLP